MAILAILDLGSEAWAFDVTPENSSPDFEIGFKENGGPVAKFSELNFGLSVFANGFLVFAKDYPPQGVVYVATDQPYLTNDRVNLAADDEVVFNVWAENGGRRYEGQTTFTVPRPEQPFSSWTWNDGAWTPPVSYPDGDFFYTWDENEQAWVTFSPVGEQGAD